MKRKTVHTKALLMFAVCMLLGFAGYSQGTTNKAYGDNLKVVDSVLVGSTYQMVFAIFSGDINQDGYIDGFDFPQFDADNLAQLAGYYVTDLNGDGWVDGFDFPVFDANNLAQVSIARPY